MEEQETETGVLDAHTDVRDNDDAGSGRGGRGGGQDGSRHAAGAGEHHTEDRRHIVGGQSMASLQV